MFRPSFGLILVLAFGATISGADPGPKEFLARCGASAMPAASFPDVVCLGVCGAPGDRVACRYVDMKGSFYKSPMYRVDEIAVSIVGQVAVADLARHLRAHLGWDVEVDPELDQAHLKPGFWSGPLTEADLPLEGLGEARFVADPASLRLTLRSTLFDEDRMQEWLTQADQGDARAQYVVGFAHAMGRALPQDDAAATKWAKAAAKAGDAAGQDLLGTLYYLGQGVPQNDKKAVRWYRAAADQGSADATTHLCVMLLEGRTTSTFSISVESCTFSAAVAGNATAQYKWGLRQLGVSRHAPRPDPERDQIEAYVWLSLAAEQGHAESKEARDRLFAVMSEKQKVLAVAKLFERRTK